MRQENLVKSVNKCFTNLSWSYRTEPAAYENTAAINTVWTNTQNGKRNFDWRSAILSRQNASSPYSCILHFYDVHSRRQYFGEGWQLSGGVKKVYQMSHSASDNPDFTIPTFLDNNTRNLALSIFYRNLQNVYQQFDGLTFLGELSQTRKMIASRGRDLLDLILKDHKRALRSSTRVRGSIRKKHVYSRTYLESVFGWLPLFSDLENLSNAFDYDIQPMVVVRSRFNAEEYISSQDVARGTLSMNWRQKSITTEEVSYSFVAGIVPEWQKPNSFGLSARNTLLSLYELTPWSFVVDYFVDLQGWLTNTLYANVNPVYSTESIKQQRITRHHHTGPTPSGNTIWCSGTSLSATTRSIKFERILLGNLPQMKGPAIRGVPSVKQLFNLGALYLARDRFLNL